MRIKEIEILISDMKNLEKYTKTETNYYWLKLKASDRLIRKQSK